MKLKLIATVLSLSLSACVSTDKPTTTSSIASVKNISALNLISPSIAVTSNDIITLEQIMSDPDWFGRAPQAWYWGDDNSTVYYQQKQKGTPLRDLFIKDLNNDDSNGNKVALSDYHIASDRNAVINTQRTHEAYIFKGNVFVKDSIAKTVQQLTFTSAVERSVMFLNNGNLAYQIGDSFYSHEIETGKVVELASLKMLDKPKGIEEPSTYIAREQHKLISYIALQHRNSKLKKAQKKSLTQQNVTVTDNRFYFGKGNIISQASLSPDGNRLFVSITSAKSSRDKSDIMPNYVTADGVIRTKNVRARVANNRQYKEILYILDIKSKSKTELTYDSLPGFDEDVLASVKKENHERSGKVYKSVKKTRNIHLLQMWSPVKWSDDGTQIAFMLEAWDNKDRWLTTINFSNNTLVSQHRLHDNAWINWSFNEFGWLNDNENLYYLSEESGYSHLYIKPLDGKRTQLTSGKFEVSDVTLLKQVSAKTTSMNEQQSFIFKGNKTHPGIYEIYSVNLNKNVTQLTNLGGMNNYSLSPDESKLLIEHSTLAMPPELYVQNLYDSKTAKRITHTVSEQFLALPWSVPNIVAIKSSNQREPIYSRVYLPAGFDEKGVEGTKKNKAVMFTHGAGYLQNSHLGWSGYFREFMFHSMLVQKGYVVIDMDYRASAGYGRDWRTSIYRHMGKVEVEDMRDGVNWLVKNANVDRKRIGTYGGSYGGFLTLMSMFTQPDLFESGSAIRLVSDWAYYNHGYTSNILNTPEDDAIAYERSSPIYFAQGLEKPLLINAPMVDDNVFFEDTVRLVQRLIELEKENFETAIYPVEPHGFVQPSSWLNEYRRIFKLFENTL